MLELIDVNTYYGPSHILQGVSLSVPEGAAACILGRNGAGKTTAVLTAMGYVKPRSGRILYRKRDLTPLSPYRIARGGFGFVPQERRIFSSLSVEENLDVARAGHKGRWNVASVYRLFPRLAERRRNMGAQLSGGEQQMLSIARALMTNPSLLLMDEPTEGLAPLIVKDILAIIGEIKREGTSILLVEQNIRAALSVGDVHYVFGKGRVFFSGSSAELKSQLPVLSEHLTV